MSINYDKSKLSIVIPTKNEGEGIGEVIKSLQPYADEIIIIDGNSKDKTEVISRALGCQFFLDNGFGRGAGVRLGLAKARGEVILLFDADGSHESSDIPNMVEPIFNNQTDLVIGSRRTGGSFDINLGFMGVVRSAGSDLLVAIVNNRFGKSLTDILYSFRAIRRSVVNQLGLVANDFTIEEEMVIKSLKKGLRVLEVPSREKARAWGTSKLKTSAGIKFIFHVLKECYF